MVINGRRRACTWLTLKQKNTKIHVLPQATLQDLLAMEEYTPIYYMSRQSIKRWASALCTSFFYGFKAIRKKAFGFGGRKLFLMARFFKLLTTKFSSPAWTLGQSSKPLQWFQSYLSDRYQSISVTNSSLPPSVLGPIVFVAYTTPHSDSIANHSIHH